MTDEIKLGELAFTAGDFLFVDMSDPKSITHYGMEAFQAKRISVAANRLLAEKLAKAPFMVCRMDDGQWSADENQGFARANHTARLVCIEEVGK